MYRPFYKQCFYFNTNFIERGGIGMKYVFPKYNTNNISLCITGIGSSKEFSCLLTNCLPDYQLMMNCQFFPIYWYEENKNKQKSLFDDESNADFICRDGVTDWILREIRNRYGARNITKEMIFYYVYGILHSKEYRERFASDLKKSLPRIPIVEDVNDFMDFYKYGKKLADLHLNYETIDPYSDVIVKGDRKVEKGTNNTDDYQYFRVIDKMRFKSKDDKSVIIYNGNITIENIPLKAYEYIVNGKSAIEWIVERYAVTQDKKSLIKNDCNDWSKEHHNPRYILDLLLSVINLSVQTVDIVNSLPKLKFD
jgi:predicted helicase